MSEQIIRLDQLIPGLETRPGLSTREAQERINTLKTLCKQGVINLLEGDDGFNVEERIRQYYAYIIQEAPSHSSLLNTKTYKNPNSPGNPHFLDMIRVFGLNKEATPRNKEKYIQWIKEQLLIPKGRQVADEALEEEANQECKFAINLIRKIEDRLGEDGMEIIQKSNSRSPAFDVIHGDNMTVPKLLHLCYSYVREYHKTKRQLGKTPAGTKEYERLQRILSDRNKSMFEIARIFAVMDIQLRIQQAHGRGTQKGDKIFLVRKMLEIIQDAEDISDEDIFLTDNPFFDVTHTETLYWSYGQKGEYNLSSNLEDGYELKLEGCSIHGVADLRGTDREVKIRHIDFRGEKHLESAVQKSLRKDLESPHEILDHRGFRFVVENESDAMSLCNILAYNLGTGSNSWKDEPHWESNANSGNNFRCLKGNLAISHKRGHTKELKEKIREIIDDKRIEYLIPEQGYQLETEIQIFVGLNSYIAAHHDPKSPANHKNYKNEQLLELALKFFPPKIYPKTHKDITKRLATRRAIKYLQEIRSYGVSSTS